MQLRTKVRMFAPGLLMVSMLPFCPGKSIVFKSGRVAPPFRTVLERFRRPHKLAAAPTTSTLATKPQNVSQSSQIAQTSLHQIPFGSLVSTADEFTELKDGEISITNPTIRATAPQVVEQHAKVIFTYQGPSESTAPLANGEERRQVALKLLAQDLCNTLYVSWQFAPNQRLEVLEKYNNGKANFENCGADGYTVIKPAESVTVPAVAEGQTHTLEAQIDAQNMLNVWADGKEVWQGSVESVMKKMKGPVGLRTDNAKLKLKFFAAK